MMTMMYDDADAGVVDDDDDADADVVDIDDDDDDAFPFSSLAPKI